MVPVHQTVALMAMGISIWGIPTPVHGDIEGVSDGWRVWPQHGGNPAFVRSASWYVEFLSVLRHGPERHSFAVTSAEWGVVS